MMTDSPFTPGELDGIRQARTLHAVNTECANFDDYTPDGPDEHDGNGNGNGQAAPVVAPATSWALQDLQPILDGTAPDTAPTIAPRTDGVNLIYQGKVHALIGEPESGKSWLATHICADEIRAGNHVLYIDYEDTPNTQIARLRALGIDDKDIATYYHYIRPDQPINIATTPELLHTLDTYQPTVAIIDGVTEALGIQGASTKDNDEVTAFWRALPRLIADHGAAVILIDHVTKSKEERGRYAIGAQAKLAASDVAYRLEVKTAFGRGKTGHIAMHVSKDRAGHVRGHTGTGDHIADINIQSDTDGTNVTISIDPPESAGTKKPTSCIGHIVEILEAIAPDTLTANRLIDELAIRGHSYRRKVVFWALAEATQDGTIICTDGPNRSHNYSTSTDQPTLNDEPF